mmetsp:Transcript_13623/g.25590  ORF Transcript_13623/g.25590 Transcript_13623/m.25590 type:complete len:405 (+) Transcript_13623:41-1255(+)
MPSSENKSVKSSRSSRSRRSQKSYRHNHDFAESSDDEEMPTIRTEFSHRSRNQQQRYPRNPSPPHGLTEHSSDHEAEDDDEEVSHTLNEEDSNLRISSLLLASNNDTVVENSTISAREKKSSRVMEKKGNHDVHDNINGNSEKNASNGIRSTSRNAIIDSVESRAIRRADACTMKMGEVMDHLHKALDLVQSYDKLNVLQEMEKWKERAIHAESLHDEMAQEIQALKKEVVAWETRTRRLEKRCERLQNGNHAMDFYDRNWSSQNHESSDAPGVETEPTAELKALLQGKSFRNKWDRKRIAGIDEEIKQVSDGESTIAARNYIDQFIVSSPKKVPNEQETRDDILASNRNNHKDGTRNISINKARSTKHDQSRYSSNQRLNQQQDGQSLEKSEIDNSWVEMLSI